MEHIDSIQSKHPNVDAYGKVMEYAVKHNVIGFLEYDASLVEWDTRQSEMDRDILQLSILTLKHAELSTPKHLVDDNAAAVVDSKMSDMLDDYISDFEQEHSRLKSFIYNDKKWELVYDNLNDTELYTREFPDRTEYRYIFSDDMVAYKRYNKQR